MYGAGLDVTKPPVGVSAILRRGYNLNELDVAGVGFTRSTVAFNPHSKTWAGVNVRRQKPVSVGGRIYNLDLIEDTATNYALESLDISDVTYWSQTNSTLGSAETDVYGETNAWRAENTSTTQPRVNQSTTALPVADSLDYCCSVWVKDTGSDYAGITLRNGGTGEENYAVFQFSTETFTSATGPRLVKQGIAEQIGDWYRIYIVVTNHSSWTGSNALKIHICDKNSIFSTDASSGIEVLFCYPQIELGNLPTTRIDTTSTIVTRGADDLSYPTFPLGGTGSHSFVVGFMLQSYNMGDNDDTGHFYRFDGNNRLTILSGGNVTARRQDSVGIKAVTVTGQGDSDTLYMVALTAEEEGAFTLYDIDGSTNSTTLDAGLVDFSTLGTFRIGRGFSGFSYAWCLVFYFKKVLSAGDIELIRSRLMEV